MVKGKVLKQNQQLRYLTKQEVLTNFRKEMHKESNFLKCIYKEKEKILELQWRTVQFSILSTIIERTGLMIDKIKDILFIPQKLDHPNQFGDTEILLVKLYLNVPD